MTTNQKQTREPWIVFNKDMRSSTHQLCQFLRNNLVELYGRKVTSTYEDITVLGFQVRETNITSWSKTSRLPTPNIRLLRLGLRIMFGTSADMNCRKWPGSSDRDEVRLRIVCWDAVLCDMDWGLRVAFSASSWLKVEWVPGWVSDRDVVDSVSGIRFSRN